MIDRRHPWHVVFAGGGTGGHLFPGLAVAEQLRRLMDLRVSFAGGGKTLERTSVEAAGYEYLPLACRPLPRRPRDAVRFVLDNVRGYRQAVRFLKRQPAQVVVGLGGYVSFPMARAAVGSHVPLVLLEQNAVPGRVTRWLAPRAALVCTSFALAQRELRAVGPVRLTGNPVRRGFHCVDPDRAAGDSAGQAVQRPRSSPLLLIMGGSLGATSLNQQVPRALHRLGPRLSGWRIVHQSGQHDLAATQALYRQQGIPARVTPFIRDMPDLLRGTSLAICRAGGTTLAELAAAGVPALLAPYPHASDDHQRRNAEVYCAVGAARLIDPRDRSEESLDGLASELRQLLASPPLLAAMSAAMRQMARPNAAWHIAMLVRDFLVRGALAA